MKQQSLASQGVFEKYGRKALREGGPGTATCGPVDHAADVLSGSESFREIVSFQVTPLIDCTLCWPFYGMTQNRYV
jgi:hypothetical protein